MHVAIIRRVAVPNVSLPEPNLVRDATILTGILVGIAAADGLFQPIDALTYYGARLDNLYSPTWGVSTGGNLPYPPVFAQLIAPFHLPGWPAFAVVMMTLCFASLWYLARGWTPLLILAGLWAIVGGPPVLGIPFAWVMLGNVQVPMAAAIVLGMRHPSWWAVPLLTKSGPGVGLLWFAVRREWRSLAVALATTAAIAMASFALAPSLWSDWARFVVGNAGSVDANVVPMVPVPFVVRLAMSAALVVWGGATDRAWTVPIAAGWAIPALYEWSFLPIWLGALRLKSD